jgi:hypothetical protein
MELYKMQKKQTLDGLCYAVSTEEYAARTEGYPGGTGRVLRGFGHSMPEVRNRTPQVRSFVRRKYGALLRRYGAAHGDPELAGRLGNHCKLCCLPLIAGSE